MTNTEHTPGPWYLDPEPDDSHYQISDGAEGIARVEVWDGDEDPEVMGVAMANARLIAAAPDLLEALRLAQRALNTAPRFQVGDSDSYRIASTVDRAITQATAACPPETHTTKEA